MIGVRGLRYRYPGARADALAGIDLEVRDGEMLLIAGASGSGKSTLARALVGLVPHFHGGTFAGTVEAYGRDTRTHGARALADVVGFVAQDPESQSVVDAVADEIVFTMENLGVEPMLMRKRLEEVLDALGLAHIRDRRLETLSGGERQRVAIAAALAAQPRCLVLDEPTSQLDPQSAEDVLAALHRLNTDLGLTIVLVEHRLERVVQHADRMVVLDGGVVRDAGEPREVLARGTVSTPLSTIARALEWHPVPLTVREGRAFAAGVRERLRPRPRALTDPGDVLLDARGVRVALAGRDVIRGVDLTVRRGETVAIVGRNGAGKTTLLRALLGLVSVRAGRRMIAGSDPAVTPVEQLAARVAYVPQAADSILFHDTVRDEVRFTLAARAPDGDADALLAQAELSASADADPRDLSAGQRLRAALLAATAGAPDVIVLDEPTRGMDASGKERLAQQMDRWRAHGAVLLVTHDVELIARCATRVVLLSGGSVVLDGGIHEVLGESPLFSSQMNKVFGDRRVLTVDDALAAVGAP